MLISSPSAKDNGIFYDWHSVEAWRLTGGSSGACGVLYVVL
jgi:hypothetical protein